MIISTFMTHEMNRGMVAFDGLSLSGKSTMVQMLSLRSLDSVVIRENEFDPLREATSDLNKLFKTNSPNNGLEALAKNYQTNPLVVNTIKEAREYINKMEFDGSHYGKFKQAALAYFFTKGRSFVNKEVIKQIQEHDKDVILDRWMVSGMAYQVQPDLQIIRDMNLTKDITINLTGEDSPYRWEQIRDLNFEHNIWVPNMQIILTCPLDQIPERKEYRQKQGIGTSGQMSEGREEIIYHSLMQIHNWMLDSGIPSHIFVNRGTPVESLQDQIKQAIPTYLAIENKLRGYTKDAIVGGFHNFKLANTPLSAKQAEEFFLEPSNLQSIYQRQCVGRVNEDMRKEL